MAPLGDNGEIAEGSSDTSGNEKSVSKNIAPSKGGILPVNSSKKHAATELYVDNEVETGKETSIPWKLTKMVTNNMQVESIPRHEKDSNKTSNLGVGAEIANKKNLSDNLTSTSQNTRTFGSGYISATTKISGSLISSMSQLQNKISNYMSSLNKTEIWLSATSIFDDTLYNKDKNDRESDTEDGMSFEMGAKSLLQEKEVFNGEENEITRYSVRAKNRSEATMERMR
ncbi:1636_t:CDS:2, partial [Acaulospora morrowiae]